MLHKIVIILELCGYYRVLVENCMNFCITKMYEIMVHSMKIQNYMNSCNKVLP